MQVTMKDVSRTILLEISKCVCTIHTNISQAAKMRYKLNENTYVWYDHDLKKIRKIYLLDMPAKVIDFTWAQDDYLFTIEDLHSRLTMGPESFYHDLSSNLLIKESLFLKSIHNLRSLQNIK